MTKPVIPGVDFKLFKVGNRYDIGITEEGDIATVNSFDTALLMSVLCERRADESEIQNPLYRRGYWGNELSDIEGFEIGSKLWLLQYAIKDNITLSKAKDYSYNGTEWFIEDNYLTAINVNTFYDESSALNIKLFRRMGCNDRCY